MTTFAKRLKSLREDSNLTQQELAIKLNISQSTLANYERGVRIPGDEVKITIAKFFKVSVDYLVGNTEYRTPWEEYDAKIGETELMAVRESVEEYSKGIKYINVYGSIPAGVPVEAYEDIQGQIEIPSSWRGKYIALTVKGDSMYPKFENGDVVIIKLQPDCETGDICACYVNGYDATLKKVNKNNGHITLQPLNPNYEVKTYTHPGEVSIVGKVVESRRRL